MTIKSCTCRNPKGFSEPTSLAYKHDYQDKKHGKGQRDTTKATGVKTVYRCTVCKKETD